MEHRNITKLLRFSSPRPLGRNLDLDCWDWVIGSLGSGVWGLGSRVLGLGTWDLGLFKEGSLLRSSRSQYSTGDCLLVVASSSSEIFIVRASCRGVIDSEAQSLHRVAVFDVFKGSAVETRITGSVCDDNFLTVENARTVSLFLHQRS